MCIQTRNWGTEHPILYLHPKTEVALLAFWCTQTHNLPKELYTKVWKTLVAAQVQEDYTKYPSWCTEKKIHTINTLIFFFSFFHSHKKKIQNNASHTPPRKL
jgi:hypothetical protein